MGILKYLLVFLVVPAFGQLGWWGQESNFEWVGNPYGETYQIYVADMDTLNDTLYIAVSGVTGSPTSSLYKYHSTTGYENLGRIGDNATVFNNLERYHDTLWLGLADAVSDNFMWYYEPINGIQKGVQFAASVYSVMYKAANDTLWLYWSEGSPAYLSAYKDTIHYTINTGSAYPASVEAIADTLYLIPTLAVGTTGYVYKFDYNKVVTTAASIPNYPKTVFYGNGASCVISDTLYFNYYSATLDAVIFKYDFSTAYGVDTLVGYKSGAYLTESGDSIIVSYGNETIGRYWKTFNGEVQKTPRDRYVTSTIKYQNRIYFGTHRWINPYYKQGVIYRSKLELW